jgi:putative tricarboxylic transport membrane protein
VLPAGRAGAAPRAGAGRRSAAHLGSTSFRRAISAPVFWMFTQFLAINLPGLTGTGWI